MRTICPSESSRARWSTTGATTRSSAAAMIRGGVYPDILGDVGWLHNDDLWFYALFALVIYLPIAAERSERSFEEVARAVAADEVWCSTSSGFSTASHEATTT